MTEYILAFDRMDSEVNPFEKIIEILYNANVDCNSIKRPVESTILFEFKDTLKSNLVDITNELDNCCYYVLCAALWSPYTTPKEKLVKDSKETIKNLYKKFKNLKP